MIRAYVRRSPHRVLGLAITRTRGSWELDLGVWSLVFALAWGMTAEQAQALDCYLRGGRS